MMAYTKLSSGLYHKNTLSIVSITPVNFRVYPFVKGTTLKRYVATDGPVNSDIVSVAGELTGEVIPLSLSDRYVVNLIVNGP